MHTITCQANSVDMPYLFCYALHVIEKIGNTTVGKFKCSCGHIMHSFDKPLRCTRCRKGAYYVEGVTKRGPKPSKALQTVP